MQEVVRWKDREQEQKASTETVKQGPVRIVEKWKTTPGPDCSSPAEEHERDHHLDPIITPQPQARYSVDRAATLAVARAEKEVPREPRPLLALVEQGGAAREADQRAEPYSGLGSCSSATGAGSMLDRYHRRLTSAGLLKRD